MKATDRKAAIRAYKERKRQMGVFAVRCAATGQAWVGTTRNLDTHQNQVWFSLKSGGHTQRSMQEAWNANGEDSFSFEALDQLSDEDTKYPDQKLKDLKALWCDELGAEAI